MFKKKKRLKEVQTFQEGFLAGITYVIYKLENQQEAHGDVAGINDLIDLITKDL